MIKTKQYFAYVTPKMVNYFEDELLKRRDKIHSIERNLIPAYSEDGTQLHQYRITAEEGIIDSRWEIRNN